jgi:hypothetical protein
MVCWGLLWDEPKSIVGTLGSGFLNTVRSMAKPLEQNKQKRLTETILLEAVSGGR